MNVHCERQCHAVDVHLLVDETHSPPIHWLDSLDSCLNWIEMVLPSRSVHSVHSGHSNGWYWSDAYCERVCHRWAVSDASIYLCEVPPMMLSMARTVDWYCYGWHERLPMASSMRLSVFPHSHNLLCWNRNRNEKQTTLRWLMSDDYWLWIGFFLDSVHLPFHELSTLFWWISSAARRGRKYVPRISLLSDRSCFWIGKRANQSKSINSV